MTSNVAVRQETIGFVIPRDWTTKESEKFYSANEMISAYLKGKEEAKGEELEKLNQELNSNLRLATVIAEDLLRTLEENHINLVGIHLKAVSIRNFEFLFVVSEESFNSADFKNAYKITHKVKSQYRSSDVNLEFSYLGRNQGISDDCLIADGYFLHYNHDQGGKA
ncbi:hypothetical protein [Sediminibacterium sp.]|uniref:hypothetical protein n=1 Tax=Sediminibacterium sp. TaxID=1917865 RepID=UPI003F6A2E11